MKTTPLLTLLLSSHLFAATRLEIIKIGHPTLRAEAREVPLATFEDPNFQRLVDDMIFTMEKARGVGLAAPQVNHSIRLFVMKSGASVPLTVVVNPRVEYVVEAGKTSSTEGCLSIPGKAVRVNHYRKIRMSYFDRTGRFVTRELSGFGAVIAQHEYDHLNGVLITDLIEALHEVMNFGGYTDAPLM
jgi:peptide deformylase